MGELQKLRKLLTPETIRTIAGDTYFERGERYALEGAVLHVVEDDGAIMGVVSGTEKYRVDIRIRGKHLEWNCTCPLGDEGAFCKHVVSVALVWTGEIEQEEENAEGDIPYYEKIRAYLATQPAEKLARILFDVALMNEQLSNRLLMEAEADKIRRHGETNGLHALIDRVIKVRDFVGYREMRSYEAGIEDVISILEEHCKTGGAAETVELCERAIIAIDYELAHSIDDSGGNIGYCMNRLMELHFRACEIAKPEPEELASSLFKMGINGHFGFMDDAAERYADLLGKNGLDAYAQLLRNTRNKADQSEGSSEITSYNLRSMEICFLRAQGNWDELIALYTRRLEEANDYLAAARVCIEAKRQEQAIALLREGIRKKASGWTGGRLSELLVELLEKKKDYKAAVKAAWEAFIHAPAEHTFFLLKQASKPTGCWPARRKKALATLRKEIRSEMQKQPRNRFFQKDGSALVTIHLREDEVEDAWRARKEFGCSSTIELELARKRAETHPNDAIPILRNAALRALEPTGRNAYTRGIALLSELRPLYKTIEKETDFEALLRGLRQQYKNRPAFLEMLKKKNP